MTYTSFEIMLAVGKTAYLDNKEFNGDEVGIVKYTIYDDQVWPVLVFPTTNKINSYVFAVSEYNIVLIPYVEELRQSSFFRYLSEV